MDYRYTVTIADDGYQVVDTQTENVVFENTDAELVIIEAAALNRANGLSLDDRVAALADRIAEGDTSSDANRLRTALAYIRDTLDGRAGRSAQHLVDAFEDMLDSAKTALEIIRRHQDRIN